jgi:hypothetical protein
MYLTPALWVGLAVLALVKLEGVIWLSLNGMAPTLRFWAAFLLPRSWNRGLLSEVAGASG